MKKGVRFLLLCCLMLNAHASLRLKTIARLSGAQENPITGYGLVVGLAGSGDSRRNKDTTQALSNVLLSFGVTVSPHDINSRNTATVIVTANLPPFAQMGDKIDINIASIGDARSLLGGTLLVTPMKAADNQIYALAQGPVSIGGFNYDLFGNVIQKNHPTTGLISNGANIQRAIYTDLTDKSGTLHLVLNKPDFTTADAIERALNKQFGPKTAVARSAQDISINPPKTARKHLIHFVSQLENVTITPDHLPTVVVNERTGVVIAGQDVTIDAVTISQGNLQISIATDYTISQPTLINQTGNAIHTAITPNTNIQVKEPVANVIQLAKGAKIADLIAALTKAHASTRDIIAVLESLQRANALHAELVIQ